MTFILKTFIKIKTDKQQPECEPSPEASQLSLFKPFETKYKKWVLIFWETENTK